MTNAKRPLATSSTGTLASRQDDDPWGAVRSGNLPQTTLGFTGQRRDGTGLLYYHARMYDPVLARFVSADSVVPGNASGSLQGIALKPLTVDFHEVGFGATLNGENGQPFWFQLSDTQRQQVGDPWGPQNPQALNRYSYVLNAPVRWADATGHLPHILQAWKEWAQERHQAIEAWAISMLGKVKDFLAFLRTLGSTFVDKTLKPAMIEWINSHKDWSESDKQILRDLVDTAAFWLGGSIDTLANAILMAAPIVIWFIKTAAHQSVEDTLRRARDFERNNQSRGGVLSPPPGYTCNESTCMKN